MLQRKTKQETGLGSAGGRGGDVLFKWDGQEGLTAKVTFEQRWMEMRE